VIFPGLGWASGLVLTIFRFYVLNHILDNLWQKGTPVWLYASLLPARRRFIGTIRQACASFSSHTTHKATTMTFTSWTKIAHAASKLIRTFLLLLTALEYWSFPQEQASYIWPYTRHKSLTQIAVNLCHPAAASLLTFLRNLDFHCRNRKLHKFITSIVTSIICG